MRVGYTRGLLNLAVNAAMAPIGHRYRHQNFGTKNAAIKIRAMAAMPPAVHVYRPISKDLSHGFPNIIRRYAPALKSIII
jgi:hypothetical protein